MKFPRYGCLSCPRTFDEFDECTEHMQKKKHDQPDMVYPIFLDCEAALYAHGYRHDRCPECKSLGPVVIRTVDGERLAHLTCQTCGHEYDEEV